jgi:peptide/nickel transport system substrate-binding protein
VNRLPRAIGALLVTAVIVALAVVSAASSAPARSVATVDPNATLTVAFPSDPVTRDPRITVATAHRDVVVQIFDGLVSKNWFGDRTGNNLKVVPALATSWTITNGGKVYTFQLRKGVRFHDGTPFNAAAVVFNFRTWLDRGFQYYYPRAAAANAAFNARSLIRNFVATGPYTFKLTLTRPFAGLLDRLAAASTTFMVSPAAIRQYGNTGIDAHPIGTGPFRFTSYTAGQSVVLTRNDRYFRGRAKLKTLVLRIITDENARAAALQAGQVQIAQGVGLRAARGWAGRSDVKLIVGPRPLTYMCWLNVREGPFAKKGVREAINLAVNRQQINQLVFDGKTKPASGFFTPGMLSFDPRLPALGYNPTRARQLLAQAGYPNGLDLKFEATTNSNEQEIYTVVQQNLEAIGVKLSISYSTVGSFLSTQFLPGIKPGSGTDGVCLGSGAEEDSLFSLYTTKTYGWPEAGGYNPGRYYSAKLDAFVEKAFASTSEAGYVANLRKANEQLVKDYALLWTVRDLNVYGVAANVSFRPAVRLRPSYYTAAVLK